MMFKSAPGPEGNQLVPDLAEAAGQASDGGKTWTYKLRQGVKFDDGSEVTAADCSFSRSASSPGLAIVAEEQTNVGWDP